MGNVAFSDGPTKQTNETRKHNRTQRHSLHLAIYPSTRAAPFQTRHDCRCATCASAFSFSRLDGMLTWTWRSGLHN